MLNVQDVDESDMEISYTINEDINDMIEASNARGNVDLEEEETDTYDIPWNEEHDFTIVDNTDLELIDEEQRINVLSDRVSFADKVIEVSNRNNESTMTNIERPSVLYTQLNDKQKDAHNFFVKAVFDIHSDKSSITDDPLNPGFPRLQLLLGAGGCGKTFLIDAALTTLKTKLNIESNHILITATTGKAATSIGGSTIYSYSNGACIPTGRRKYTELQNRSLMRLQQRFEDILAVIVDEFSMLDAKSLFYLDQRLRQAKNNQKPFGGIVVLLCGDTAQLPPVKGIPLWGPRPTERNKDDEINGVLLFKLFQLCTILTESNRLDTTDSEYNTFKILLQQLRDGLVSEES